MKPHFSHTGKVQAIHMTQKYRNISFSKRKRKTSLATQAERFYRLRLDTCSFVNVCRDITKIACVLLKPTTMTPAMCMCMPGDFMKTGNLTI